MAAEPMESRTLAQAEPPLVVDLDGTLVRSDLLLESLFLALRRSPRLLLKLPGWVMQGAAACKRHLIQAGMPEVATLPYRSELVELLRAEKQRGRRLVLATAGDQALADAVSAELGFFDAALGSDGHSNLAGAAKARRLVASYGEQGFDYAGNSWRDQAVWTASRQAIVAGHHAGLAQAVRIHTPVVQEFRDPPGRWKQYLRELRPPQWIKNLLVFLPLASAAHLGLGALPLLQAALAFVSFTACAASVYLLNDLLDLPSDRRHPHKRRRPLASGAISISVCCLLMLVLLAGSAAIGWALHPYFLLVLAFYYTTTLAYSFGLKDQPILDVLILAGGYAARVVAGAVAIGAAPASWMIAFCVFLFFSLALLKRYAELALRRRIDGAAAHARGYRLDDIGVIAAQGIASGYIAVLVLALYADGVLQKQAASGYWLFGSCLLLLYWISAMWLAADRGRIEDDPVTFALKDPLSRRLLLVMAILAMAAV